MSAPARLLADTLEVALAYLEHLDARPVGRPVDADELLARLPGDLQADPSDPREVIRELVDAVEPGLVASSGPRYFGYVVGGTLPAALAADWLTSAWDQQAGVYDGSPAAAVVEQRVARWLLDLFELPAQTTVGFVTGTAQGHLVALAAARWRLLRALGWDVAEHGMSRAPAIKVLVTAERHVTVDAALRHLGVGRAQITFVPTDDEGRMRVDSLSAALRGVTDPVLVCAQAGNVNTGACDPLDAIAEACSGITHRWIHVDGAFGMWARVDPARRHLVRGLERADSWAADAHKWLNVPYDSGFVFVADAEAHAAGMTTSAAYSGSDTSAKRDGSRWTPEFSRRARGFAVYAALRSLGSEGVRDLITRDCELAAQFALAAGRIPGAELLNSVPLNQVLLRFAAGDTDLTAEVIARIQRDGAFWAGQTRWRDRPAMRVSVSGWSTTERDVERAVASLATAVAGARG